MLLQLPDGTVTRLKSGDELVHVHENPDHPEENDCLHARRPTAKSGVFDRLLFEMPDGTWADRLPAEEPYGTTDTETIVRDIAREAGLYASSPAYAIRRSFVIIWTSTFGRKVEPDLSDAADFVTTADPGAV